MKVLVIHPEDELQEGPWGCQGWDRVIDLGRTGEASYVQAAAKLGCQVTAFDTLRDNFKEMRNVRDLLALGLGRLSDRFELDWWELTSILVHQQVEIVILLQTLVKTLGPFDEIHVSRPCFHAEVLRLELGARVHTFSWQGSHKQSGVRRYFQVMKKFPMRQVIEIFWDKADPGYQFRGSISGRRKPSPDPVVLLPSAYINVSRTAVAYAEILPEARFLLVVTRRSGWIPAPPPNVSLTWLRRYASVRNPARELEHRDLVERWSLLRRELKSVPEFRTLMELGSFDDFPDRFRLGLEIRDAWQKVLELEPVEAVICADDSNPYTHIPLLLAVQKRLPTISCHHGALDGRYMFKRNHADVLLAKGKMEEDYLVRICEIPSAKIEIGAPILPTDLKHEPHQEERPFIVLFSEAYEVAGGRARGFYQDILPALADLAISEGKELIIKLHPSESLSERRRIAEQILRPEQQRITRLVGGRLEPEMLNKAWFGVTILSTIAVDCALRGIPCFLCAWLESWPYKYVDQFVRFGVGIRLHEPGEIRQIPVILKSYKASAEVQKNCWSPIKAQRLRALLGLERGRRVV